jgi:tetratricopeptide (TPR) repeat protein
VKAAAAVSLVAALVGCAPEIGDAYKNAFAAGERAAHAGRHDEAAAAYERAAAAAARVKDRDEALFLEARELERAGKTDGARATLSRLVAVSKTGPRTVRALFDLAELEIDHGDEERGFAMLEAAARAHPEHGLARPSIQRIARRAEERGGPAAALAWLRAAEPAFRGTEQDQVIHYAVAQELLAASDAAGAHDAFIATAHAHPYPFGGLTDDALFHAAEIDRDRGRHEEAIAHLRELVGTREKSDTVGSYERPRYSEAQMKIAEAYRDGLRDHAAARREFHRLYADFKTSILRDDALWAEARLARQDGDAGAACDAAKKIVREFPDSRYAPCAPLVCPDAPAAGGKRGCADYISRDVPR